MEYTATTNIETTEESWKVDREEASKCPPFDLPPLIDRVLARWDSASVGYRAGANAEVDRATKTILARSLREAEQTIVAVLTASFPGVKEGYLHRMKDIVGALMRCRMLIVQPVAERMAERDEEGRSAREIALLIARDAQFIDGRAVIDQALASKLPSPYKPEATLA